MGNKIATQTGYPTYTFSTGYEVAVRRLSPDVYQQVTAAAQKELQESRPVPPKQIVAIDEGKTAMLEQPTDPAYQKALADWQRQVSRAAALKFRDLVAGYAIMAETDLAAVTAYREAMAAIGVVVEETDRNLYVWNILAPTSDDQVGIMSFVLNRAKVSPEAIQAQKDQFRGNVSQSESVETPGA